MSASNLVQRILEGRQVACPDSALDYGMAQLPHYDAIDTLPEAGARIAEAVIKGERITVVGDFDCDGCTATSVVLRALSAFGADADYIIPHRSEGHGITPPHIERAAQRQSSLVITVDNGSDAHEAVLTANKLGIDLVITDHHTVTGSAAQTPWLVNPMVGTSDPELRKLAGVGVAFYTMLATRSSLRQQGRDVGPLSMCYELVAIGTVADMMTLNKVNRILVSAGLNTINQGKMSLGLKALLQVSGRLKPPISAQDIGFGIAPLINAAGRLADMSMAVDLFMATDPHAADAQANKLVALNEDRKKISARRMRQAMSQIEDDRAGVLCVYQNDWEQGIIGLLAGSLVRMHERPAVAFTSEDANDPEAAVRGSMRSPEQFSAIDAIAQVASERPHLINGFGGHSGAAGMELPNAACIPLFTAALEAAIAAAPAREVKPTRDTTAAYPSPRYPRRASMP